MGYLLNALYLLLAFALAPWLIVGAVRKRRRPGELWARFRGNVPVRQGDKTCVWLHAVSVGEVNLLAPLIQRLEKRHPDWQCVVSASTRAGYELACRKYAGRLVFLCPLDFTWAVHRTLARIRPDLLLLAELELWPNLIRLTRAQGARVAVFNGRLSESSFRGYRRLGPLMPGLLSHIDCVAAQNATYAQRFVQLGADPAKVHDTGSIKFDGAQSDRNNPATVRLRRLAGMAPDDVVLLAGSTQAPEEQLALASFLALAEEFPKLRLIITPRHPERFDEVAAAIAAAGLPWRRRSRLETDSPDPAARLLLVDTVGELGAWWGTAQIAFVGGSLGSRGGQNMIEPAAYGAAVCFGPNTRNFRDIVAQLLQADAAQVVHSGDELTEFVRRCLRQPAWARAMGDRARRLVASQTGAADRTCALVEALLPIVALSPVEGLSPVESKQAAA